MSGRGSWKAPTLKGKTKQERESWKPGGSAPKPWDKMILGKKQWLSMLKGMAQILLRNSYRKSPKVTE